MEWATTLPLRSVTGFLRISKSSYEYWRRRLAEGSSGRDADIGEAVGVERGTRGYQAVHAQPGRAGVRCGEKRARRVMCEEGLVRAMPIRICSLDNAVPSCFRRSQVRALPLARLEGRLR